MFEFIKNISIFRVLGTEKNAKKKLSYVFQFLMSTTILYLLFKYYVLTESSYIDYKRLLITLFLLILSVIINMHFTLRKRYTKSIEENNRLTEYIKMADEFNFELRRFKHNYLNILTTLYAYISEDTNQELRDYFMKIVDQCKEVKNTNLAGLSILKIMPLKSILAVKINQALASGIFVETYCDENVSINNIEMCDLCEVLGVYLDNAIEECKRVTQKDKRIVVCIMNVDGHVIFEIKNTYFEKPDLFKFFWNGYSTKGENRGIGLYCAKKILNQYEKVYLNTYVEEEKSLLAQVIDIEQ